MTDREAAEVWDALSAALLKSGFGEVLHRVEAYLRQGKIEEREVVPYAAPESDMMEEESRQRQRPGPRGRYFGVAEYSPKERVQILAEAILHAIVYSREMEHETWEYLDKRAVGAAQTISIQSIRIVNEPQEGLGPPIVHDLSREAPGEGLSKLQEALEFINREAQR